MDIDVFLWVHRISDVCDEAFTVALPSAALFDPTKVAIVSNGRCASSCSLFSVRAHLPIPLSSN